MRPDAEVGSDWTFNAGAGWTPGGRVEAFVNNLTREAPEAGTIISSFEDTRVPTGLRTFGAPGSSPGSDQKDDCLRFHEAPCRGRTFDWP